MMDDDAANDGGILRTRCIICERGIICESVARILERRFAQVSVNTVLHVVRKEMLFEN
jgi:hypothetical protein